jgi:hypothetical protein
MLCLFLFHFPFLHRLYFFFNHRLLVFLTVAATLSRCFALGIFGISSDQFPSCFRFLKTFCHTPSKTDHKEKPELLKSGCCCLCRILSGTGPFRRSVIFTFAVIFVSLFQLEVTILTIPPVIGAMPLGFIDGDSILLNEVLIGVRNSLDEVRRIVFVSFSACLSPVSADLGETCIDDYSSFWFCFGFCSWHN